MLIPYDLIPWDSFLNRERTPAGNNEVLADKDVRFVYYEHLSQSSFNGSTMTPDWKSFLIEMGANITGDSVTDFGNPSRELRAVSNDAVFCDLSYLGLIKASGADAAQFLQSQFCNDVMEISESHSQLNAYCSPKGRMLASFRIFKRRDDYFLRLPAELLEETMRRLRMFVLRSKVELTDASDALVRVGYCAAEAYERLQSCIERVPQSINECVTTQDLSLIRIHGIRPRFEIHGKIEAVKQLWYKLTEQAIPVGASQWALLDILAGIATVLPPTREAFVPQMANMDLIGALSFTKGCYPGQEIVARMHYLGQLKRRTYLVHIADDGAAQAGDEVFVKGGDDIQPVGKIVDARPHPDGGSAALAVVQIDKVQQGDLSLGTLNGAPIALRSLPYA